jgi:hypothetical protein
MRAGFSDRRVDGFGTSGDAFTVTRERRQVALEVAIIPVDCGTRGHPQAFAAIGSIVVAHEPGQK